MEERKEQLNGGVLIGRDTKDWVAGANSEIKPDVFVDDGNWKPYAVEHEIQWTGEYDTLFCVTYSALSAIASLMMYKIKNNLIPATSIKWLQDNGYFKNGFINFNERFIGTLGETTNVGAYQYKVANAIKNYGLIPQDMFPLASNFQDNIDPKFITQEMKDLGKEFLNLFQINYEWVSNVKDALKYSPVQMVVRFANYEKPDDILAPSGEYNHAVKGVFSTEQYNEIKDTYWQVYKKYRPDKTASFMAFKITVKNMDNELFIKQNDLKWIRNQKTGSFGRILQGELKTFQTTDRACLALLDDKVRKEGLNISDEIWSNLPKNAF